MCALYISGSRENAASQCAHMEHARSAEMRSASHAPNDVLWRKSPCEVAESVISITPVRGRAVKQSAEMRSALEFFATAQSFRERLLQSVN